MSCYSVNSGNALSKIFVGNKVYSMETDGTMNLNGTRTTRNKDGYRLYDKVIMNEYQNGKVSRIVDRYNPHQLEKNSKRKQFIIDVKTLSPIVH